MMERMDNAAQENATQDNATQGDLQHTDPRTRGFRVAVAAEKAVERISDRTWHFLKRRPMTGIAVAAAAGLAASMAIGVGELAMGVAAGYAAFQILVKNAPPSVAIKDALQMDKQLGL